MIRARKDPRPPRSPPCPTARRALARRELSVLCAALAVLAASGIGARRARAQLAEDGPGLGHPEVLDLSSTMRDDDLLAIAVAPYDPRVAFVGTTDGRIYRTRDGGASWIESTAVPERRQMWAAPGASVFLGSVRSGDFRGGRYLNLAPWAPEPRIGLQGAHAAPIRDASAADLLHGESRAAAGSAGLSLGVGISERAPRLSLLVGSRGRSVPSLSVKRLIFAVGDRHDTVIALAAHPTDRDLVIAGTSDGIFRSRDGGSTWVRTHMGATLRETVSIRIEFDRRAAGRVYAGTGGGLLVSENDGETWRKVDSVPGFWVNAIVFDPSDPRTVYLATSAGVWRSDDGGGTFAPIYMSSLPSENDVRDLILDPADPQTALIGTPQGVFITRKARTATRDDWAPLASMNRGVLVFRLLACSRHPGHYYAMTKGELPSISYWADPPESLVFETRDGGRSWTPLFSARTRGDARAMALSPDDPDQVWITWSRGVFRVERRTGGVGAREPVLDLDDPALGPSTAEVIAATMRRLDLDMRRFDDRIARARSRSWIPRTLTVTGIYKDLSGGGVVDQITYPDDRLRGALFADEWRVVAWASWSLPSLVFAADSVPMLRTRVLVLNDMLRGRLTDSIYVHYGELRRLQAILRSSPPDSLETRAAYAARIEQLEAIVDLTSGGYLTRWRQAHGSPEP